LENFIVAGKLAAETKRLTALFTEVLKIPGVPEIKDPVTCPVCETLDALTPARIGKIREQLQASEDYRKAQTAAQNALRQIETASSNLSSRSPPHRRNSFRVPSNERRPVFPAKECRRCYCPINFLSSKPGGRH
jgi:hypothetical protein